MSAFAIAATVLLIVQADGGDATRGATLYDARCAGCHSVDDNRVGPLHRGLLGRRAGTVAGYAYSPALASAAFTWDGARLDRWLADPESVVPGQRMGYRVLSARDRADLIAYLRMQR